MGAWAFKFYDHTTAYALALEARAGTAIGPTCASSDRRAGGWRFPVGPGTDFRQAKRLSRKRSAGISMAGVEVSTNSE